jgi:hypothetical protein
MEDQLKDFEKLSYSEMKVIAIESGKIAVSELLKVARKALPVDDTDDNELSDDKLTRAAQAKKMALFDAFEMMAKLEQEQNILDSASGEVSQPASNFTERLAKIPGQK